MCSYWTVLNFHSYVTNAKAYVKLNTPINKYVHIDSLQEFLKNKCIPKVFNTKNKTTWIYEELRKKYSELNSNSASDYLPLLIEWLNSDSTVLGTEVEFLESALRRIASESDYLELRNILFKEHERINKKWRNKRQRKLHSH